MTDPELLRSLDVAALEAEAAIRRDENDAAADLALSLRQGADLRDTLRRWGSFAVSLDGRNFRPCTELGCDYVVLAADDPTLVPLGSVSVARLWSGAAPTVVDRSLLSLLRDAARRGCIVEAEGAGEPPFRVRGLLLQASSDHLVVRASGGEMALRSNGIRVVRLPSGEDPG